ncbi:MAG: hypothetical protein R2932_39795, partial [Caldilineaceae bacterium]
MIGQLRARWRKEKSAAADAFMVCPHCHHWGPFGRCEACGFEAGDSRRVGQLRAQKAVARAKRRTVSAQMYQTLNGAFALQLVDLAAFLKLAAKWLVLGGVVGVLAGTASWIFLTSLAWATAT